MAEDLGWEWHSSNTHRLGPMLREMVQEIIQFRELLWQMVLRDIRIRYKQAVMGFGWAIFMPLLIVGAGCLVKIALARASGDGVDLPRVAGMSVKALGWAFFAGGLGFAANSLVSNMTLVTKVYFPRELFPLSAVLTQLFDTLIGGIFLVILLAIFAHVGATWNLLWVPLLVIILVAQTAAAALLFSCANVFFRDVKYIVQVLLTFGIFFTPVFYEPELFGPKGASLMMANPLSPVLEGLRLAIVEQHNLMSPLVAQLDNAQIWIWHPAYLLYAGLVGIIGLVVCWWIFHRSEFIFAEYI
ncbi:MAG: ABC transporter permease [Thermogutta sp.]